MCRYFRADLSRLKASQCVPECLHFGRLDGERPHLLFAKGGQVANGGDLVSSHQLQQTTRVTGGGGGGGEIVLFSF